MPLRFLPCSTVKSYSIQLVENSIKLRINSKNEIETDVHPATRLYWLEKVLAPRLGKMYHSEENKSHLPNTLSLVDRGKWNLSLIFFFFYEVNFYFKIMVTHRWHFGFLYKGFQYLGPHVRRFAVHSAT